MQIDWGKYIRGCATKCLPEKKTAKNRQKWRFLCLQTGLEQLAYRQLWVKYCEQNLLSWRAPMLRGKAQPSGRGEGLER